MQRNLKKKGVTGDTIANAFVSGVEVANKKQELKNQIEENQIYLKKREQ